MGMGDRSDGEKGRNKRMSSNQADVTDKKKQKISIDLTCTENSLQESPLYSDEEILDEDSPLLVDMDESKDTSSMFDRDHMKRRDEEYRPSSDIWIVQTHINPEMRTTLVDWLYQVSDHCGLQKETVLIAINYVDRYLGLDVIEVDSFQMVGVTALFIAAKFQEVQPLSLSTLADICDEDGEAILQAEMIITDRLQWLLSPPTPLTWLHMYVERGSVYNLPSSVLMYSAQLIEYYLLDHRSLRWSAGHIAAAVFHLFCERYHLQEEAVKITEISAANLKECIDLMSEIEVVMNDDVITHRLDENILAGREGVVYNASAVELLRSIHRPRRVYKKADSPTKPCR